MTANEWQETARDRACRYLRRNSCHNIQHPCGECPLARGLRHAERSSRVIDVQRAHKTMLPDYRGESFWLLLMMAHVIYAIPVD